MSKLKCVTKINRVVLGTTCDVSVDPQYKQLTVTNDEITFIFNIPMYRHEKL